MLAVSLQVLQLRMTDFAVDLRERFKAAHREQRWPKAMTIATPANSRPERAFEPAQRFRRESQILGCRGRRQMRIPRSRIVKRRTRTAE